MIIHVKMLLGLSNTPEKNGKITQFDKENNALNVRKYLNKSCQKSSRARSSK